MSDREITIRVPADLVDESRPDRATAYTGAWPVRVRVLRSADFGEPCGTVRRDPPGFGCSVFTTADVEAASASRPPG